MDQHTRDVLELGKVEAILATKTSSPYGRMRVESLRPFGDVAALAAELDFVQELRDILAAHGRPFSLDIDDLSGVLKRCRVERATLDPESLRKVAKALAISEEVASFVAKHGDDYPELARRTKDLLPVPPLRRSIDRCIDPASGGITDACSRHLREVRREKERVRAQTLEALRKILAKQSAGAEDFITIRGDRYVIPVESHRRSAVRGIVHDTSSSGATLFVEPLKVVELNNRLCSLTVLEKEEENRLLAQLTGEVREHAEIIDGNNEVIGELDFAWAKAQFGSELGCVAPIISNRGLIRLVAARHPLLVRSRGDEGVVPLGLEMSDGSRTLLISGPNMGGKTVALKTVGLLALMMACGLHIPARDGSELPLFDNVFADIGDGQSIEQDLSTFAAHVRQLGKIADEASAFSLVLLDEIGSGTDPREGGALARAMLKFLTERGLFCVATTHLGTLKPFVAEHAGMVNACMEFDAKTLKPTYLLQVGFPGRSMALEIAEQLGLPGELIRDARDQLSAAELKIDALLADADQARLRARELEEEADRSRKEATELRALLEDRVEDLTSKRRELERQAKDRCREMVERTRRELESALKEAKMSARADDVRKTLRRVESLEDRLAQRIESGKPSAVDLSPGKEIWVNSLGVPATIVRVLPNGRATVERKGVRVEVPISELREPDKSEPKGQPAGGYATPPPKEEVAEVVVIGMSGDEALEALEREIDAAVLQGLGEIKVVHGKGKGVLRTRIAGFLSGHSAVESFRLGEIWEGGTGVTVAKLK